MLLLLPTPLVPLLIVLAALASPAPTSPAGRTAAGRAAARASPTARSRSPPPLVLIALDAQTPAWSHWPAYVAALPPSSPPTRSATPPAPRSAAAPARSVVLAETCAGPPRRRPARAGRPGRRDRRRRRPRRRPARAARDRVLAVFAREREARVAQTVELGRAYRGTALLLRDLLEEDDEYTGHHTEDVVELSVGRRAAGRQRGVRRETEMGALLHDIGKIAHPRRDHQQARRARRRGVGDDEDPHGRRPADARPRRRPAQQRRRRRARLARALRRRRLPGRPRRRARSRSPPASSSPATPSTR